MKKETLIKDGKLIARLRSCPGRRGFAVYSFFHDETSTAVYKYPGLAPNTTAYWVLWDGDDPEWIRKEKVEWYTWILENVWGAAIL